ncbi:MAG TPA: carboxylesterase family protein, partial [Bacteroidales bacterium]|nr:carboxylesterase family protein [Bacteroidales bacterium]
VGSTLHEFTSSTYNPLFRNIDKSAAVAEIEKKYGERTSEFLTDFENAYPDYQPKDLLDVDFLFRPNVIRHANIKYGLQGAPVYTYLFTWESPVIDGMFRSTHCMELPFVFNNVTQCNKMTGGTPEAYRLAEKISSAWLNFAKTGDPNASGLPHWETYTIDNGATMIFDEECELKYHHDRNLIEFVNSFKLKIN